jgi:hypothetical protein
MRLRTTPAVTSLCRGSAVTCWPHGHRHFSCLPRSLTLLQRLASRARTTARFGIGFMDASDQWGFRAHQGLARNVLLTSDKLPGRGAAALGACGWQAFGSAGHRTFPAAARSPRWLLLWRAPGDRATPMAHRCSYRTPDGPSVFICVARSPVPGGGRGSDGARQSQVRGRGSGGARASRVRGRDTPREPFGKVFVTLPREVSPRR